MIKNYLKKLMFLFIALAFSGLTYGQVLLNRDLVPELHFQVGQLLMQGLEITGLLIVLVVLLDLVCIAYSAANNANTWAFTPDLAMEAGKSYTIQFQQKTQSATYPEKIKGYNW